MALQPRVRWPLVVLTVAACVALGMSLFDGGLLLGVGTGVVTGVVTGVASLTGKQDPRWIDRALATRTDPGLERRADVDSRARSLLARSAVDDWLPFAVVALIGALGLVLAVVRSQVEAVWPSVVLLAVGPVWWIADRNTLRAAGRWLTDPPYDREVPA